MKIKLDKYNYVELNYEKERFDFIQMYPELHYPGVSEELTTFQNNNIILNKGQLIYYLTAYSVEVATIIFYDMLRHGWKKIRFSNEFGSYLRDEDLEPDYFLRTYITKEQVFYRPENFFELEITVNRKDIEKFKSYLWSLRTRINIKIWWIEGDFFSDNDYKRILE